MEKQILNRGYVTNALTDDEGEIYGMIKDHHISWDLLPFKRNYYWSEVYSEPNMCMIVRKGTLLADATPQELKKMHEQSKVNLSHA